MQASMEKHFKKHIEDDQQQLLAEARGGPHNAMRPNGNGGAGVGPAGGRSNTKGLLRVKLSNNDRQAAFSRVVAPGDYLMKSISTPPPNPSSQPSSQPSFQPSSQPATPSDCETT